ncbi:G-type lectin S-receptor-like serine/threonine-protein kinase At1g11330 [Neltuma alba]|uniref:G-type lectin S-receptor-like serine/threonine-protein kinase At1g11330 n=1 Tax=Neltuma alba TaxID=207710 RepID=UPI0010A533F5|nr:G-type lectin S-receptor-like serine/threonine-protein kinase At1g11330 [Prosopis alba]
MNTRYLTGFYLGKEDDGTSYITYDKGDQSYFGRLKLNSDGKLKIVGWVNKTEYGPWIFQDSKCDVYGYCMNFGICNRQNSTICSCFSGFEPKKPKEWNTNSWTNGCVRKTPLQCKGDGFLKLQNMKVPDFAKRSDLEEANCRTRCLENCSCLGYAYDPYIQCLSWSDRLIDMQRFPLGGVNLYIRLANSELVKEAGRIGATSPLE